MKKILTFLFLLVACFAFVSCKNPDDAKIKQIDEVMNQLFQDTDLSNVSTDLNFVTTISGVKLTYQSSDEDVLTNEGKVTLSESSKTVTLEVTFELDGYKKNKEYTITIASLPTPSYMSISKVKTLEKDTEVTIRGIVSRIINGTEKNVPVGFYVFDKTDAIYIYSSSVAETVMFGEEVIVKGTYTMYIDETSMTAAEMVGYTGARQIVASSVEVITSGNALPTSGVKQSSIEELALTSVSENITSNVYEVTATIKKVPGNGFVNYYFNDLNGINSFYAYTTANGKDLSWLEKYDGQTRKCMIAVQNCKISASGSLWRIVPLEIREEVTVTDQELTAYALKRVLREFSSKYSASCSLELLTKDEILTTSSVTYEVISGPITLDGNILKITCTSTLQKASIKVTITIKLHNLSFCKFTLYCRCKKNFSNLSCVTLVLREQVVLYNLLCNRTSTLCYLHVVFQKRNTCSHRGNKVHTSVCLKSLVLHGNITLINIWRYIIYLDIFITSGIY